jgi:hypothetical protein
MPVKISNNVRRMLSFNLVHGDLLKQVTVRTTVALADGRRYPKTLARRLPRDLTLTAKGTPGSSVDGLPDAVLSCPDIANAIKRREISFSKTAATTEDSAKVETSADTQPSRRKRGRR